ncbi:CoA transferase [Actinomadura sp. SCN-SB]|uniref:CaiB/BaiF CoA-transferase family protein n=1 Tax=Actinomadura sp. SCN-SB TaxID=3373092 RepID=UPI0037505D76
MTAPDDVTGPSPLRGVRVLEVCGNPAGRVAGMLLADLGAEVVRVVGGAADRDAIPAEPGELCWDRGKSLVAIDAGALPEVARTADVLLVDHSPRALRAAGLAPEEIRDRAHRLVHVWAPPYAARGEFSELPADPILLDALGVAGRYPSRTGGPVAPVVPTTTYVHGAMIAATAVAGLVGRRRLGTGTAVEVSGLHAIAAQMTTMMVEGLDQPVFSPGASGSPAPCWRAYRCADGRWFFLATLTPGLFFRALEALDRMDIMVLPEVAGEFSNILVEDAGGRVVTAELEALFASRPCGHWLELLEKAAVPCAPVATRDEWIRGDPVVANAGTVVREHPELGPVTMPGSPIIFAGAPGSPGRIPSPEPSVRAPGDLWAAPATADPSPESAAEGRAVLPLAGVKVLDASTFLAAPFVASLLADFGADVVKVEPAAGDPYRVYPVSFLAVNQRKRGIALDLTKPEGADVLRALVRGTDVLVENFRPGRMARIGLPPDSLRETNPGLVHCSVTAYGQDGASADAPGFDPIFQSLSGMASAQGGDGEPIMSAMPAHDTCTGVLGALGVLAALYARGDGGSGTQVAVSLAATSTYLQSAEFTDYAGRPAPLRGGTDFRGPAPGHRYHRCSDGWIAIAATGAGQPAALRQALDLSESSEDDLPRIERALRGHTVRQALRLLSGRGVPACRVVQPEGCLDDPFLVDNEFAHLVHDPELGRLRVVAGYALWASGDGRAASASFAPGQDGRRILAAAGYGGDRIEALVARGAVAGPVLPGDQQAPTI